MADAEQNGLGLHLRVQLAVLAVVAVWLVAYYAPARSIPGVLLVATFAALGLTRYVLARRYGRPVFWAGVVSILEAALLIGVILTPITFPPKWPPQMQLRLTTVFYLFVYVAGSAYILGQEKVEHDDAAVALVAREAAGSMRDALSLLDQVIAGAPGAVLEACEEFRTEAVFARSLAVNRAFHSPLIAPALGQSRAENPARRGAVARLLGHGQLLRLESALELYKLEHGEYPRELRQLADGMRPHSGADASIYVG